MNIVILFKDWCGIPVENIWLVKVVIGNLLVVVDDAKEKRRQVMVHQLILHQLNGVVCRTLSRQNRTTLPVLLPATQPISSDEPLTETAPPVTVVVNQSAALYESEHLVTFFRQPAFSPDGALLFTPTGLYSEVVDSLSNGSGSNITSVPCVHVYSRDNLSSTRPTLHLTGFRTAPLIISACPVQFSLTGLDRRNVFAVATQDSVVIYDTEEVRPIGLVSGLHYGTLTDLAWCKDGSALVISSLDGYCSVVTFEAGELGKACPISRIISLPTSLNPTTTASTTARTTEAVTPVTVRSSSASTEKAVRRRIVPTLISSLNPSENK